MVRLISHFKVAPIQYISEGYIAKFRKRKTKKIQTKMLNILQDKFVVSSKGARSQFYYVQVELLLSKMYLCIW